MTSPNPIPEAIPSLPPYRPIKLIQPVVAVAHASLVIQRLRKAGTRLNLTISPRELEDRTRFLLVRFRIHINRRYENSQKSGHLRKLCSSFLLLNPPATKICRKICTVAKEALSAAPRFPDRIKMSWWRVRNYLCKSTLKQKECPSLPPWPLANKPNKLNEVRMLFWNTNGNHLTEHKRTLLNQTADELKLDIIALAETKTTSTAPPIPTFNTCSYRRPLVRDTYGIRSIAGGICVGKSASPDVTARTALIFDGFIEATATIIKASHISFTLITAYVPPLSNSPLRGKFEDRTFLQQLRGLYKDGAGRRQPLVMLADMNVNITTMLGKGASTLRHLLRDGWDIRNSSNIPTFLGSREGSCIDVVLTRNLPYTLECGVIPMSATDHQALHVIISAKTSRKAHLPNTCNKHAAKRFASALEEDEHPLHEKATDILTSVLTGNITQPIAIADTDQHSKTILNIIQAINAFEAAEKKTPYVPSDPLYIQLKQLLHSHYSCFLRCRGTTSHRGLSTTFRRVFHLKKHIYLITSRILDRNSSDSATKAYECAAQSKNLASISRRIERAFSPNSVVLNIGNLSPAEASGHSQFWTARWGQNYHLPSERLSTLDAFLAAPPQMTPSPVETPSLRLTAFSITHDSEGQPWLTTPDEIEKAIRLLANNKAPGISGLPVDFFKLTQSFHQDLELIFNDIIKDQATPQAFSSCRLVLLYKAGLISEPKNYRPINLTDTTFRIFESVLRSRMKHWSERVLHHDQYGFREAQSTMSALMVIITSLHLAIASKKPLTVCFLDAVKAFDRVPHKAIMESLMNHGLCPASCRLIQAVISNHVSCIVDPCNPEQSIRIAVECGVLQGGILSPFFFSCFADSFFDHPNLRSAQALYADDRTFLDENPVHLQESLTALENWASTRNLLHGGNEYICVNTTTAFTLTMHGETIPRVQTAKCLGINISENGNIERPKLIQKASLAAIKISSTWGRVSDKIPLSSLRNLICRYLLPTSLYGSAFFTDDVGKSLDTFMFQILRKALHAHPSTNTRLMLEFTGIIRPTVRIQQEIVSVLCRMLDNTSTSVRSSIITQFDFKLPFASKTLKLFSLVSRYSICGPPLTSRLNCIIDRIRLNVPDPESTADPDPYVPCPPSNTHLLAFTDGSTSEEKQSGCAVICLVGGIVRSSSFYLPGITENNAAELSAIDHLIDIAATYKHTDFPGLIDITIVTDSLNCVSATHGTSLVKDPPFISLLHTINDKVASNGFRLFTKWVKAHDEHDASPYNQLADEWSSKSISTKQPSTVTALIQAHNITQATLPLPWNKSELPPSKLRDHCSTLHSIASNCILMHEDAHYRQSLHRYIPSRHSNFPGTGSIALRSSTIPGSHCLFTLRRDPAQHYADHPDLQHLAEYWYRGPCPWCQSQDLPTNFHLLHECPLTTVTPVDRHKIAKSRRAIFSGSIISDWPTRDTMDDYLTSLTSSTYSLGDTADHANMLVKHQSRITRIYHKWRTMQNSQPNTIDPAFDIPDAPLPDDAPDANGTGDGPLPSNVKYHTSPEARQLILDRLEDCRSVAEFDQCIEFYRKKITRIGKWAHESQRAFFRPVFFRQWLHRVEAYLTIVNCPTHQIRHQAYLLHEARTDRAYHKNTAMLPSQAAPPGATHVHFALQGWIPKMTKIKKLLCRSLIRYTPANPSDPLRPARRLSTFKYKGLSTAHHRTVPSPSWSFSLNWTMLHSTPLVEAWLAAPTSLLQRTLVGPAWPSEWPKDTVIQTRKKINPEQYERATLANAARSRPLLFLFDLILEALTSGELTTDPPFPRFPAAVQAKQATDVHRHFTAFHSAAVMLIFTPIDIWRQQGRSFSINPINVTMKADLPATITPFPPRLEVYTRLFFSFQLPTAECIAEAADWSRDQMEATRRFPRDFFPPLPADIPGSSTASPSRSVDSWMLDDDFDTGSSDDDASD